jgi:hypothetical protein
MHLWSQFLECRNQPLRFEMCLYKLVTKHEEMSEKNVKAVLEVIPRIPLWIMARILRLDKRSEWRHHDVRTLRGWMNSPVSNFGIFFGWFCWALWLGGLILVVRWAL